MSLVKVGEMGMEFLSNLLGCEWVGTGLYVVGCWEV